MTRLEALRDACQQRCADFGDPPCYRAEEWPGGREIDEGYDWCAECREDVDGPPESPPFDPNAAIGRLL